MGQLVVPSEHPGLYRIVKAADETINNSAVMQDDDELVIPIAAGEVITGEFQIWIDTGAGPAFKCDITAPALAGGWMANAITGDAQDIGTDFILVAGGAAQSLMAIYFKVVNGVNAGNITFRWAQQVQNASDTIVKAGSFVIYTKV